MSHPVGLAAFVVVTQERRDGSAPPPAFGRRAVGPTVESSWEPVGVRRAMTRAASLGHGPPRTLCGQDATDWHAWPGLAFIGRHCGDCLRYGQLAEQIAHRAATMIRGT